MSKPLIEMRGFVGRVRLMRVSISQDNTRANKIVVRMSGKVSVIQGPSSTEALTSPLMAL